MDAATVADWVWKSHESVTLSEVIEQYIAANGASLTDPAILNDFDRFCSRVRDRLLQKITAAEEKGLTPKLRFSAVDPERLILQRPALSSTDASKALQLIQDLKWRDFELLCRLTLSLTGVDAHVLRGTKDGGIDIFGTVDPSLFFHPAVWKGVILRVFCQVKKGAVGEPQVRLLLADVASVAQGKGKAAELIPESMTHSSAAVVGGIFTARKFSHPAQRLASANGCFTIDPERLIEVVLSTKSDIPGLMCGGSLAVDKNQLVDYLNTATQLTRTSRVKNR